jgi:pimeloyl-ACP methyl ester carboxylesterase
MPALAIDGEKANGEVLGRQIKVVASNATVVVLKNTGYWVLEENPKETTDALMNFLLNQQRTQDESRSTS